MNTYVPIDAKFVALLRNGRPCETLPPSREGFNENVQSWRFAGDHLVVFLQDDKQVYAVWSKPRHVVTYPDLDTALTAVTLKS